ncbi:MAG: hypothetical protein JSU94_05630 [Phycisphaerales bacterium]|nr:MAG: hypothetical protein JSU94_05630 [Phycisphaerales bacterium]
MCDTKNNQPRIPATNPGNTIPRPGRARLLIALALILAASAGVISAVSVDYPGRISTLADQILFNAEQLRDATNAPTFDSLKIDATIAELRTLLDHYEQAMVFAESPYPGEILLATTPPGDSTWLEALCTTRYTGPVKEIRLRRTGNRANYLRINDIEIFAVTRRGPEKHIFNKNGRVRLYRSGVFKLALPSPMTIRRIRININHESTGLEVTAVPYAPIPLAPPVVHPPKPAPPREIHLGTTPPGHSTWLETLLLAPYGRPITRIMLRRTGSSARYIRINDIELTFMTPRGLRTRLFNENARAKLYPNDTFTLSLPMPMRPTRIRVRIDHESSGLEIYGI